VSQPTVAVFTVGGHLSRDLAVIEALLEGGLRVVAFGDHLARHGTEELGAEFVDIYDGERDTGYDDSFPSSMGFVTFAGEQAGKILRMLRPWRPGVVVSDSHAVVGRVVAQALEVPHVIVWSGHISHAGQIPELMRRPDLHISERCRDAVKRLRDEWRIDDASPFLYRPRPSPDLNLYGEPAQWLPVDQRSHYEPVRFFGSLSSGRVRAADAGPSHPTMFTPAATLRVYAAFGATATLGVLPEVLPAFEAIVDAVQARPGVELLIGLGRHPRPTLTRRQSDRVRVQDYADQWRALAEADVFITHQGAKSTHEAIFHQVPMVSYPLKSDQPRVARDCQRLNLAVALTQEQLAPVQAHDVLAALDHVRTNREAMSEALALARTWEQMVIAGRPAIVEEIARLAVSDR
jgi:UDP:flavonoid glycosyltransferase YjiC (YdhE family)